MDLQKVKDALLVARNVICHDCDLMREEGCISDDKSCYTIDKINNAIAELEKIADDAGECAGGVLALFANGGNIGYVIDKVKTEIQQYAESYHAKKCIHCQKIVYCERCGDPISTGICENCNEYLNA